MRLLLLILFCVLAVCARSQVYGSSSMMETKILDYRGIQFLVKVHVQIEATNEGGLGDRMHKVLITDLSSSIHQSVKVDYRGKTYHEYSFNNALSMSFTKLQITSVDLTVELTAANNCTSTSFSVAKEGSTNSILCGVDKGKKLGIARINISRASFEGFTELFALIDKLEAQAATQAAAQKTAAKNTETPSADPWGSSEKSSQASKPISNNYSSASFPTNSTTTSNSSNLSTNRTNSTTSSQAVNSQGYNASGAYAGLGTYNKTGSGTIATTGPGKLRADGNYDVVDKRTGQVEIISKSENQKLLQRQQQQAAASTAAVQQQKLQEMYRQQEQMRLNQQRANLAREQQMRAAADQLSQSIGTMASAIGSMIADAKAKKEREKQRAMYAAEQERIRLENIAMEKKFRRESRDNIIANFKEGTIPLFTSKITADKLYYFVYAYDKAAIEAAGMNYFVSNVVEIKKAGDGTWPYKRNIDEGIQPLTPYEEIFHGQYLSPEEAEAAKIAFEKMMDNSGAFRQSISFMAKKNLVVETGSASKKSLWDNEVASPKTALNEPLSTKKDPFWDLEPSTPAASPEPNTKSKAAVDLWSLEVPAPKSYQLSTDTSWKELEKAILDNEPSMITTALKTLPVDENNLYLEALWAHGLYLTQQTDKALEIYKKHRGQSMNGTTTKWEDKINTDLLKINKNKNLDFTPVKALFQ